MCSFLGSGRGGAEVKDAFLGPGVQPSTSLHNTPLTNCTVMTQQKHSLWGPQARECLTSPPGIPDFKLEDCLPYFYSSLFRP